MVRTDGQFDKPTEKGGNRWLLAQLFFYPKEKERRWRRDMLNLPPLRPGEKMPKLTDAQVFGHEFYRDLPTDKQIKSFLRESGWTPRLGKSQALRVSGGEVVTIDCVTTLVAGGVVREMWKERLGRDVPTDLFPELKKAAKREK